MITWMDYTHLCLLFMIFWKVTSIYDKMCEGDEE